MGKEKKDFNYWKAFNGKMFYYAFISGAQKLISNQVEINKINVFPVADADTGTNLASTFRSILENPIPTKSVKQAACALADAALIGARGNSGIIFAQFLHGFGSEISTYEEFNVKSFSESVNKAVKYAYDAISNPVEGTMITVIKVWAEKINEIKDKFDNIIDLLKQALIAAKDALLETTKKLEILAKNNVVDAGAKGFVVFLEGIIEFFTEKKSIRDVTLTKQETVEPIDLNIQHEEITFRYCCEAMLSLENHKGSTKDLIKEKIQDFGDSLVVAGSNTKARIHIHSDNPVKLFETLSKNATIIYQKVDDMVLQQDIALNAKNKVGLLVDSTADLPAELVEKHQITVIPLNIIIGENSFLDNTTISSEQFYSEFDSYKSYPTTSQPSYKDFVNKYQYLSTHYDAVVGIHISESFSGTFSNSRKAATFVSEQSKKPIYVHNSNKVSSALGLTTLRAAESIENGADIDKIRKDLESWNDKTHIFVSAKSVKYLIKSGRLSYTKGLIGRMLNVNPVLGMDNKGKPFTYAKAFNEKQTKKAILQEVNNILSKGKIWGYSISHINNPELAEFYANAMRQLTGQEPKFINDCSPVLGVNGGPGLAVLSLMEE